MRYRWRRYLCHGLGVVLLAWGAQAQAARLALVIGNDGYRHVDSLRNARNDARAMAETLTAAGFKVTRQLDADRETLFKAVDSFALGVKKEDEVVFFFSGHGVQLGSEPYLLPVDIGAESARQVGRDGLRLDQVANDLAKARYALLIIDACRDNPFPRQGTKSIGQERGLQAIEAPEGMAILLAAGRGQKALDRLASGDTDPNGLFTRELLRRMKTPGLPVSDLLKSVRDDVERKAGSVNHKQRPALVDESRGTFYFFPPTAQVASLTPVASDPLAVELAFWNSVKDSGKAEELKLYLERYPQGQFAGLARGRAKSLEAVAVPAAPAAPVAVSPAPSIAGRQVFRDCGECPEMVAIPGKDYALGKTEVTQGQWKAVMGSNPSHFSQCGDDCPVENVSWDDAQAYIKKLNEKTGKGYRLPQESEWRFACHGGGSAKAYCGGDEIETVAWYRENSGNKTWPVGRKAANGFGLFDMSGNVFEWMEDCWEGDCGRRVLSGGSWSNDPQMVLSADRNWNPREIRKSNLGFRLARMLP